MFCFQRQDGSSIPVKQFHYMGWTEEGPPDTGSGLIDLIGQVQKWQMNSGDRPVVVHCRSVDFHIVKYMTLYVL